MHALGAGPVDGLAILLEDDSKGGGSNAIVSERIGLASVEIWAIREEQGKRGESLPLYLSEYSS